MHTLDRTTWPEFRDTIAAHEARELPPRRYPGYATWKLPRLRRRWRPTLDQALAQRRCPSRLGESPPSPELLGRLLGLSHGVTGEANRGPAPSAGGLQALELYLAQFASGWLPAGIYHYDRVGHAVAQLAAGSERESFASIAPSLALVEGGALLWILVGDLERVRHKYGDRAERFLLLEAGHLMQNLCLASASVGWATVPLGGFFERDFARLLTLLRGDEVLYVGVAGALP